MTPSTWIRRLLARPSPSRVPVGRPPKPRARPPVRLLLDALEDRFLLSTITVTNTNDSGPGSLRSAILNAPSGATINFAANLDGQTIGLTSGQLALRKNLTITGPGADRLTVSGTNTSRVFDIQSATVAISGLSITGGYAGLSAGGGILITSTGSLALDGDTISGNRTGGRRVPCGRHLTAANAAAAGREEHDRGTTSTAGASVTAVRAGCIE